MPLIGKKAGALWVFHYSFASVPVATYEEEHRMFVDRPLAMLVCTGMSGLMFVDFSQGYIGIGEASWIERGGRPVNLTFRGQLAELWPMVSARPAPGAIFSFTIVARACNARVTGWWTHEIWEE